MQPTIRPGRVATLLFGVALLASSAACGGSTATPPPTTAPAPTATPAPTPSPTPDPYKAMLELAGDAEFEVSAEVEGTVDAGTSVRVTGVFEASGKSVRSSQDFTVSGKTTASEQRVVSNSAYNKLGALPWRRVPEWSGSNLPPTLGAALTSTAFTQATASGSLHLAAQGKAIGDVVEALLLLDPSMALQDGTLDIAVGPAGELVTLDLKLTATMANGTRVVSALSYAFDATPNIAKIMAPSDVWILQDPGRGYTLWTPHGWTSKLDEKTDGYFDSYFDPNSAAEIAVNCYAGTWTLAEWVKETRTFLTKNYGAKPDTTSDTTISGQDATVMIWNNVKVADLDTYVINVSMVNDTTGCDVRWYNDPGTESADIDIFDLMTATFSMQ
jgi:hypothetical protein